MLTTVTENIPVADINQRGHRHLPDQPARTVNIAYKAEEDGTVAWLINIDGWPCENCGTSNDSFKKNPETGRWEAETFCTVPAGVTYEVLLNIPSGKIAFSNTFRDLWAQPAREVYGSLNHATGQMLYAKECEKEDLLFGSVVPTSGDLYLNNLGDLVVASLSEELHPDDDEWDEEAGVVVPTGWTYLGSFLGSVAAYSIVDYDEYIQRGGESDPDRAAEQDIFFAEVPAGVWAFSHYASQAHWDEETDEETDLIACEGTLIVPA